MRAPPRFRLPRLGPVLSLNDFMPQGDAEWEEMLLPVFPDHSSDGREWEKVDFPAGSTEYMSIAVLLP